MRKYKAPTLLEYGSLKQLTLGTGGGSTDAIFILGNRMGTSSIGCSVPGSVIGAGQSVELRCK